MDRDTALNLLLFAISNLSKLNYLDIDAATLMRKAVFTLAKQTQEVRPVHAFEATCGICGTKIGGDGDLCNRCAATNSA